MDNLALTQPENLTVIPAQEVIEYFLNNQTQGTAKTYGIAVRTFFAWTGGKSFRDITPLDALNYNEYLKRTCAEATVQSKISALTQFFKFAVKGKLIGDNPFGIVKQTTPAITTQNKFLTVKELDKLLTTLAEKNEKHYVFGLLLAATGIRILEAQQLSWSDIMEIPDGTIAVNVLGKGGKRRLLPLRYDVWRVLHQYMGDRPISQIDQTPLFKNPSGNRISTVGLRAWIENAAKKANISKEVTPHTLRHTFCSLSLSAGASSRDVQAYAGHKSLTTTERYLHAQNMKVSEFMPINVVSEKT